MALNDYAFQLTSSGVILNDDSTSFPYVDLTTLTGLDNAPYRETMRDHEGVDGGFIDAEFETGRQISLEGTVYAQVGNVETYLDSLKANFAPRTAPIPLFLKMPGVQQRLIFVKPRGCRYSVDTAQRTGCTPIQFLMYAEDPRIYDDAQANVTIGYGGDAGIGVAFLRMLDTFTRVTGSGWGTSDTLHTYTLTGTAADFATNGTKATITLTAATGTSYFALSSQAAVRNNYMFVQGLTLSATPTAGTISAFVEPHVEDASNFYRAEIIFTTSDTVQVALSKTVAGVPTTLVAATTVGGLTHASLINVRVEVTNGQNGNGTNAIRAKVYAQGTAEPAAWTVEAFDTALVGNGQARVGAVRNAGNTNSNPVMTWDQLESDQGVGFNIDFGGGATPAGASFTNSGNRPTPVVFLITGPVVNPVIINNTTGEVMAFTITLSGTDTLTVDTLNRTVYLNGNVNRRSTMTTNKWIFLPPGTSNLTFGGGNGVGSSMNVKFRSAWR